MEVEFIPELTDHTSQARARKIIKGKRTKRQRPCSPNCLIDQFMSSEEDEDMANCLIMLAQSESLFKEDESESKSDPIRQKTEEMITATRGGENEKSCLYVYECKTCNRTFPSFQALGGHRASHKKPKVNVEEKKSSSVSVQYYSSDEENDQHKTVVAEEKENTLTTIINNNLVKSSTPLLGLVHTGLTNNKTKVHECSICGSEFSSGQALGGHMRKHRPIAPSISRLTEKSQGGNSSCMLSLDLNFPPPEMVDDVVQSKFKFTNSSSQPHMVFSAPALVDCHY